MKLESSMFALAIIVTGTVAAAEASAAANKEVDPERVARAEELLSIWDLNRQRDLSPEWKAEMARYLQTLGDEQLDRLLEGEPLASVAAKDFGDPSDNLVFTPVKPCRVIDTRNIPGFPNCVGLECGVPLARDVARSYLIAGTSGFVEQGGEIGGCGVPEGSPVVMMNLQITRRTGKGNIQVWPFGDITKGDSALNFPGDTVDMNAINAVSQRICDSNVNPATCTSDINIELNNTAEAHFVGTIYGYFAAPTGVGGAEGAGPVVTTDSAPNDQNLEFFMWRRLVELDAECSSSQGTFVVTAQIDVQIEHDAMVNDRAQFCVGDSNTPADCSNDNGFSYGYWEVDFFHPGTDTLIWNTVTVQHVQEVTDCDEEWTFYLNGRMTQGGNNDDNLALAANFNNDTKLTAVFYPN